MSVISCELCFLKCIFKCTGSVGQSLSCFWYADCLSSLRYRFPFSRYSFIRPVRSSLSKLSRPWDSLLKISCMIFVFLILVLRRVMGFPWWPVRLVLSNMTAPRYSGGTMTRAAANTLSISSVA